MESDRTPFTSKLGRHYLIRVPNAEGIERRGPGHWVIHGAAWPVDLTLPTLGGLVLDHPAPDMQIPVAFLEALRHDAPLAPLVIATPDGLSMLSTHHSGQADIITAVVESRSHGKRRLQVARELVRGQMIARGCDTVLLFNLLSVDAVREAEAQAARAYWSAYFRALGLPSVHRRSTHEVTAALNAADHVLIALAARAALTHGLPLDLGFLHQSGPAPLAYDLVEPLRVYAERAVATAWASGARGHALTAASLVNLQAALVERISVAQIPERLHRNRLPDLTALTLRRYCLAFAPGGRAKFMVPEEAKFRQARRWTWVPEVRDGPD